MKKGQYPTPRYEPAREENVFKAVFNPAPDTTAGVRKLSNDIAALSTFTLAFRHASKLDDYAAKLKRDNKAVAEYMNADILKKKYPRDAQRVLFTVTGAGILSGVALGVAGLGAAAAFTVLGAAALPIAALAVLAVKGPDIFYNKADKDAASRDIQINSNLKKIAEAKIMITKEKEAKQKPVKPVMKDFGGTIGLALGLCLAATGIATGGVSLAIFGGALAFFTLARKAKMGYDAIPSAPVKKPPAPNGADITNAVPEQQGTATVATATVQPAFTAAADNNATPAVAAPAPTPVQKPPAPSV